MTSTTHTHTQTRARTHTHQAGKKAEKQEVSFRTGLQQQQVKKNTSVHFKNFKKIHIFFDIVINHNQEKKKKNLIFNIFKLYFL